MADADLAFAGVVRQAELVRSGEVSPRELVELSLSRIERLNPKLNAFRTVYAEKALLEAEQAAARLKEAGRKSDARDEKLRAERPLLGVPIAVKDAVAVAGDVLPNGTDAYEGIETEDAEFVKRIRAAGAIVVGKTNVPELCLWPFTESKTWGVTRNPWDRNRTPGGSSGGSAAAVAAGMVPAATASDGGGSIRIPAWSCGIFGLKPQRGRVPLAPYQEHWHGLSVNGWVTRSVADTGLLLDTTAGPVAGGIEHAEPPTRPFLESARAEPGKLRVAVSAKVPTGLFARVTDVAKRGMYETADLLRSLGHQVDEVNLDYGNGGAARNIIVRYLCGAAEDAYAMPHPQRLERRTRGVARIGSLVPGSLLARARAAEAGIAERFNRIFESYDVVLTPMSSGLQAEVGKFEGMPGLLAFNGVASYVPFCASWNVIGQPAASVPAGFSDEGLPLAVQVLGRPHDEGTILSLAAQIERERPWADKRPPIS
jgi:amidase